MLVRSLSGEPEPDTWSGVTSIMPCQIWTGQIRFDLRQVGHPRVRRASTAAWSGHRLGIRPGQIYFRGTHTSIHIPPRIPFHYLQIGSAVL